MKLTVGGGGVGGKSRKLFGEHKLLTGSGERENKELMEAQEELLSQISRTVKWIQVRENNDCRVSEMFCKILDDFGAYFTLILK